MINSQALLPDFRWQPWKFEKCPKSWYQDLTSVRLYCEAVVTEQKDSIDKYHDWYTLRAGHFDRIVRKDLKGLGNIVQVNVMVPHFQR
jgi:hypothetical protein